MREAEDLIERERSNHGVVLFFSSSELVVATAGREVAESNEDGRSRIMILRSN